MIKFLTRHPEKIYIPLLEHIQLVFLTLVISVAIAAVLTLVCLRSDRLSMWLQQLLGVVYSIPSLALFAILIPVTGLGRTTAVIALTAYNQYLLLRNFTTGLREVDPAVTDAAKGIGMTWLQVLTRVQIPLAKRALFAGGGLDLFAQQRGVLIRRSRAELRTGNQLSDKGAYTQSCH